MRTYIHIHIYIYIYIYIYSAPLTVSSAPRSPYVQLFSVSFQDFDVKRMLTSR